MTEHFWRIIETSIPICLFYLEMRRRAKKEQDKRHKENQEKLERLLTLAKFLPPHKHDEKGNTTPLTVQGITYEPKAGSGLDFSHS